MCKQLKGYKNQPRAKKNKGMNIENRWRIERNEFWIKVQIEK